MPMDPELAEAAQRIVRWSPYAWCWLIAVMATIYVHRPGGNLAGNAVSSWPLRRYRGDLWTERARRAWPSRRMGGFAVVILGLPLASSFAGSLVRVDRAAQARCS